MNNQPIEKMNYQERLSVHSVFLTIQGEGPFAGKPAIFIRLAGCNLQCPGCDTEYTSGRGMLQPLDVVHTVKQYVNENFQPNLIVITGGEPFRQDISPLCELLDSEGFDIQVETNGTLPPSPKLLKSVVIVCSPKTGKMNPAMAERVNHLKYVLNEDSVCELDGLPVLALGHKAFPKVARPPHNFGGTVYLQPMDCKDEALNALNLKAAMFSCMRYGYTLQLQIHKMIGVE